jgi:hypothetical protein
MKLFLTIIIAACISCNNKPSNERAPIDTVGHGTVNPMPIDTGEGFTGTITSSTTTPTLSLTIDSTIKQKIK